MSDFEPDDALVARFVGVCGCDPQQAQFMLEAANGSFDRAVQMFFGGYRMFRWQYSCPRPRMAPIMPPLCPLMMPLHDPHAAESHPGSTAQSTAPAVPAPVAAATAAGVPALPRPRAPGAPQRAAGHTVPGGVLGLALRLPVLLLGTGWRLVAYVLRNSLLVANALGDRIMPAPVMRSARGEWAGSLRGERTIHPPALAAAPVTPA